MADFKTHALVGCVAGVGAYLLGSWFLQRQISLGGLALSGLGGLSTGCLPDVFEPALNPNHRSFFHSLTAGGAVGYLDWRAIEFDQLSDDARLTILVLSAGYISHLILDAATPKSLPVF